MKIKCKDIERMYFAGWAIVACCLLLYKYVAYGCILVCGDWYD